MDTIQTDYWIIQYVDSAGCVTCGLKLNEWSKLADEFQRDPNIDVRILIIVASSDKRLVKNIMKETNYKGLIALDNIGDFRVVNKLSKNRKYRTFALNPDREIIALGNPISNNKMYLVYQRAISSDAGLESENYSVPDVVCDVSSVNLGLVKQSAEHSFRLFNPKTQPIVMSACVLSCDCLEYNYDNDTIFNDGEREIKFKVSPPSGFFKYSVKVYFHNLEYVQHLTMYGVAV